MTINLSGLFSWTETKKYEEHEFTDFDVVIALKDNKDFVIEIPIFEVGQRWTLVVRSGFKDELYFSIYSRRIQQYTTSEIQRIRKRM